MTADQKGGYYITYDTFPFDEALDDNADKRGKTAPTHEIASMSLSRETYLCETRAESALTAIEDDVRVAQFLSALKIDAERAFDALYLKRERRIRNLLFTSANYNASHVFTGVTGSPSSQQFKQFDASGSDAKKDFERFKNALIDSGVNPAECHVIVPQRVYSRMKYDANFTGLYGTDTKQVFTLDRLADFLEIPKERIHVPSVMYNAARRGNTKSLSNVWHDAIWIGYVSDKLKGGQYIAPNSRPETVVEQRSVPMVPRTFAATFNWMMPGVPAGAPGTRVIDVPDSGYGSKKQIVEYDIDERILDKDLGVLIVSPYGSY